MSPLCSGDEARVPMASSTSSSCPRFRRRPPAQEMGLDQRIHDPGMRTETQILRRLEVYAEPNRSGEDQTNGLPQSYGQKSS